MNPTEGDRKTKEQLISEIRELRAQMLNIQADLAEKEQQLHQSEHLFDRSNREDAEKETTELAIGEILESITDGFLALDRNWCFTYLNEKAEEMLRQKRAALLGKNIWQEFPTTIDSPFYGAARQALAENISVCIEAIYQPNNTWWEAHFYPSRSGISLYFRDISQRKQSEEELYRREQEFKALVENAPDIIARIDRDLRYTYVNRAVEKATGRSPSASIGRTLLELGLPTEITSLWQTNLQSVFATGVERVFENPFSTPDGIRYYQSRIVPEFAKDGSISSVLSISRDVTEFKQTEEALRESNQRLDSLIQASPLAIVATDREGKVKMWSPAAEKIFGWKEEEVLENLPPFVIDGEQPELRNLHQIKSPGGLLTGVEARCQKKSGKLIDIAIWSAPLRDGKGNLSGTMALIADISERQAVLRDRKKAEMEKEKIIQLLENEQALLEAVLQQMPAGVMIAEAPSGKLVLGNKLVEKIWRQPFLEANSIEEYQRYKAFYPDGKLYEPQDWPLARSVRNGEVVTDEEINFQRGDGNYGTMRVSSTPIYNYEGKIIAGVVTFYDITDRKRAKEALRTSEERFRILVNSMQDIVFTLDREQRYTGVFGSWWEKTGTLPESCLGRTCREIFSTRTALIHEAAYNRALAGETLVYEWSFESSVGIQYCQTSLSPLRDEYGETIGVVGVGRDITQMRRAEKAQRFLAEASKVLTASLDYETTLKSVARLAVPYLADYCAIFVLEDEKLIRQVAIVHRDPAKELQLQELQKYTLDPNADTPVAQVLRTGESLVVEEVSESFFDGIRDETSHYQFMCLLDPKSFLLVPLIARGRTLGAIAFTLTEPGHRYEQSDLVLAEDLASRAALAFDNARLYRQAKQANQIKDEFLAIVSHELRTPLNSILGWATLLRNRKFDESMMGRALETIERNARMQSQLIEDLLDVSRMLRGKLSLNFHPVNLVGAIEAAIEVVRPAAETSNIELEFLLPTTNCLVYGDFNRLQQIVWNLLSNAIKFTPSGGRVRVELSIEASQEECANPQSAVTRYAQIQVRDTGKGIDQNFLPYVFERFRQADSTTTRSHGGLGLGLAIVRHLIELHGGRVHAASDGQGRGATFTVSLPLLKEEAGSLTEEEKPPFVGEHPHCLTGIRVLVVDDDPDTLHFLTAALTEYQARVTAVGSARAALEALEQFQPDVLISDIGMPDEDGYSLIGKLKNAWSQKGEIVPAVALTAYAMETDRVKVLDAGFQKHLAKPVSSEELVSAIVDVLKVLGKGAGDLGEE
ncbi:MAG TPA: PAS domain S-box protein [Leptolyngbyaceae cyanobacterium]